MQCYIYRVRNSSGSAIGGELQAETREAAISVLRRKGYFLLSVEEQNRLWTLFRQNMGFFEGRVNVRSRAIFTHQLATLLKAGMQLSMALKTLSKQTENKRLASVIKQLDRNIEESSSLSEAMKQHPRVFPAVYTAVVGSAEESGSLAEALANLSKQLKSQASVNARIRSALSYPVFLLVLSAVVVGVLVSFVVPKFIELFVNANQELPLPTQILIGLTSWLRDFWWALLLLIAVGICLSVFSLRQELIRMSVDRLLLNLPLLGALNRKLQLARFARTLGSLLNGGVRIVSAINITKGITANRAFSHAISEIEDRIVKGSTLENAVREQSYFTEVTANMIAVGENSGMLPEMLLEVADIYEQEAETAIDSMTRLLGPIMVVVLGLIIGFVVLAILLPIFETSALIG